MKYTNLHGLPQPVFDAIVNDKYSRGDADISVTQLIDSPRVRVLEKKHDHEIVVDASDQIQSLLGKGMHFVLEDATKKGIAERRLSIEVSGWKISGAMDLYDSTMALDGGVLTDYKSCNVWKFVNAKKGTTVEFERQLNVYAEILRQNGHPISELWICALIKDWKIREFMQHNAKGKIFVAGQQSGYPERHFAHFQVPLWTSEIAQTYILKRVLLHQKAEKELPYCTADEVWNDATRCKRYCKIKDFCDQAKEQLKTGILKKAENE